MGVRRATLDLLLIQTPPPLSPPSLKKAVPLLLLLLSPIIGTSWDEKRGRNLMSIVLVTSVLLTCGKAFSIEL
ncbi:hypothetical protein B0O80DRAFT_447386 [Mortierella sp. GBAus27b]|nr:hypothetical protein B0O80DRAFT_447386 [Mortierella sp. GBAus27b]